MNKAVTKSTTPETRGWLDPFDSMYEDMDKLFSSYFKRFPLRRLGFRGDGDGRLFANLDISETNDAITVEIDAPGVKRSDIDITLTDSSLQIKGKRESHKEEEGKNFKRIEREYGEFERRVALPCEVDANRVDASLKDGVLTIRLPKTEKAKEQARKIEVHA